MVFIGLNIYSCYYSEKGKGFPFVYLEYGNNIGHEGSAVSLDLIPTNILLNLSLLIFTILIFYFFQRFFNSKYKN